MLSNNLINITGDTKKTVHQIYSQSILYPNITRQFKKSRFICVSNNKNMYVF